MSLHLTQQIDRWVREQQISWGDGASLQCSGSKGQQLTSAVDELLDSEKDEPGLLDLDEEVERRMSLVSESLERITEATTKVGESATSGTTRLTEITERTRKGDRNTARREAKGVINGIVSSMEMFRSQVYSELPMFTENLMESLDATRNIIEINSQMNDDTREERNQELSGGLAELRTGMAKAVRSYNEFADTLDGLPPITTALNRVKRTSSKVIREFCEVLVNAQLDIQTLENRLSRDRVTSMNWNTMPAAGI